MLYAQHGFGKTHKIEQGLSEGVISGVVLSPKDEAPGRLSDLITSLGSSSSAVDVLMDTQFHAFTVSPVRDGHLPEYPYYRAGLRRNNFIAPSDLAGYVKSVIDFEGRLGLTRLTSPTVCFEDFRDPWSQISLSLASESASYHGAKHTIPPLLVSLVFTEHALANSDSLEEFLDIVSLLKVQGFYIVVRRSTDYSQQMDETLLQNLLYMCYTLSTINGFEVVVGYADIIGVLLHAVGVSGTSTGWYNGLRQFSLARFQPSSGGKLARPRYTSETLLNSVLVVPEMDSAFRSGKLNLMLSNSAYDGRFAAGPANAPWNLEASCLHHWEVIHRIVTLIESKNTVSERLDLMKDLIDRARSAYADLKEHGVVFETASGPSHLIQWEEAIEGFRGVVAV
jgi:hypothetical protein